MLLCRNNNLSFIYAKETALGLFGFEGNPNLEYICIDSDKVDSIQQKAINYGYFNCVVNDACNLSVKDYNNPEFTLFPNPAADVLNIISDTTMIQSVAIYNVLGQKIISIHENAIAAIDVSSLKTGNYFIKINSDKGTTNAKFAKK